MSDSREITALLDWIARITAERDSARAEGKAEGLREALDMVIKKSCETDSANAIFELVAASKEICAMIPADQPEASHD